ncbi:MAG: ATP-dependent zinc metalloprotease FtsH [Clostridia bacterium]|nr:ATP-dependent zinc metalloprotease FtsH [Clostridia bacterium]
MNQNNNRKDNNKQDKPSRNGRFILIVIAAIIGTLLLNTLWQNLTKESTKEVTFDEFLTMVDEEKVKEVTFDTETITFKATDKDGKEKSYYTGTIDNYVTNDLVERLESHEIEISGKIPEEQNYLVTFLLEWILPILVMAALFLLISRFLTKRMDGLGGIGGIGQSKAKVYMEKETGVTFRDVAGQDEAKESLVEIIDFLHNPKKYTAIGAKLPKGALLVGSPGTGKTLLAKAVAGEAHVPFFSISGSDFVEMFVGVGASRVRDLFQQAAKVAPAIIFIDEIDAIGRSRDSRFGGNDEREQTLNQLLAEIDGFDSSKGVVILAATNRPEILDKALLRAGRFDRRIIVDRPNLEGRYQTLRVHTRNIKLAEDVDLHKLAQATAGAVGADLANLVNEAALRAVRLGRHTVNQEDLLTSFEVVIAGTEKKGTVLTDIEKRIVSYHEVGHALVAALQKNTKPVSKITIVPHTSGALGYTMQTPEEEKYLSTKQELLVELQTLLGGRAAEQTVFGVQTTGAANDIERATELARKMVMQFGMSDKIGLMNLTSAGSEYLDDKAYMDCSQATASDADAEVRILLDASYKQACALLQEHRELLDEVALFLLQRETITGDELMTFVEKENEPQEQTANADETPQMPTAEAKGNEG